MIMIIIIVINFHFFCQNVFKSGQWYLVQWNCSTRGGVLVVCKSASVPRVYNAVFFSFSLFEICKWREEFLMNFDDKLTL